MKNGFTARPVIFEGCPGYVTAGYMVEQYNEGQKVAELFVSDVAYKDLCQIIGIVPTMEGVSA